MPRGNPQNLTPWKPGVSGNPGGRTSAQRQQEVLNAEMATFIRGEILEGVIEAIELMRKRKEAGEPISEEERIELSGELLRLLTDSENRGLGTPVARTEISGKDGAPIQEVRRIVVDPKAIEEKGDDDV